METLPLTLEELIQVLDNVHNECTLSKPCCHREILNQIDHAVSPSLEGFLQYLIATGGVKALVLVFSEGVLSGLALAEVLKLKSLAATE